MKTTGEVTFINSEERKGNSDSKTKKNKGSSAVPIYTESSQ